MPSNSIPCAACGAPMDPVRPWLSRCRACGFLTSDFEAGSGTGVEGLEQLRLENFERILDCMAGHAALKGARLLEVGCARGWFLKAAERRGCEVRGIEPEAANAVVARSSGLDVAEGLFPGCLDAGERYDFIVFNDVFEHLPDPAAAIRAVEKHLRPDGIAVINLPSADGAIYRLADALTRIGIESPFNRLWQRGMASPHISYFAPDTLAKFVARHTSLQPLAAVPLASVSRNGLRARIASTQSAAATAVIFPVAWAGSYVLGALPSDIVLGLFRKRAR